MRLTLTRIALVASVCLAFSSVAFAAEDAARVGLLNPLITKADVILTYYKQTPTGGDARESISVPSGRMHVIPSKGAKVKFDSLRAADGRKVFIDKDCTTGRFATYQDSMLVIIRINDFGSDNLKVTCAPGP